MQPIHPVLTETLVIQGNKVSGIRAYTRNNGKMHWDFKIKGGLAGSILAKGINYFSEGRMGLFTLFLLRLVSKIGNNILDLLVLANRF